MNTQYLYVMGSESGVGKSTICLGILALLLDQGWPPSQLAYIKPMTQCEEKQPIARFCNKTHIACNDSGCLVFRKGFSKDFIDGATKDANALKAKILAAIANFGHGKAIVVIDGVGGPSVGSVIGVSNMDIAASLPCRIIFVGKPGIGAAIDDTILCVSFMHTQGDRPIGLIYNKIPVTGLVEMRKYVTKQIQQLLPNAELLGFLKESEGLDIDLGEARYEALVDWFGRGIDAKTLCETWGGIGYYNQV